MPTDIEKGENSAISELLRKFEKFEEQRNHMASLDHRLKSVEMGKISKKDTESEGSSKGKEDTEDTGGSVVFFRKCQAFKMGGHGQPLHPCLLRRISRTALLSLVGKKLLLILRESKTVW